jgi:hypothetical protein
MENNSFFSSYLPYLLKQGHRSTPIADVEYFLVHQRFVCRSQNPPKIFAQSKRKLLFHSFPVEMEKYIKHTPALMNNEKLQSC